MNNNFSVTEKGLEVIEAHGIFKKSNDTALKMTPDELRKVLMTCVETDCQHCLLVKDGVCVRTMCLAAIHHIDRLEAKLEVRR